MLGKWAKERLLKNKSNLALVLLITKAKADKNVPMAELRQVLSLHQGDPEHPAPHLVLRLSPLWIHRPLGWCGLVLLRGADTHRQLKVVFYEAPCEEALCAPLRLPAPASAWHLIMFTECMKVGQRFTLYSTSLLEHISTSLLTGKSHHGDSWRERKRGTSASSQMSLAVTVPLITGSQTECGEAGHLAYCTRDSRQQ